MFFPHSLILFPTISYPWKHLYCTTDPAAVYLTEPFLTNVTYEYPWFILGGGHFVCEFLPANEMDGLVKSKHDYLFI